MVKTNKYYDKTIKDLSAKKDSIFEPCRITSFNMAKFTATVYGMRSNQVKENVLVLFPSLFLNSGIISIPVKNSTGILFVGADNESYLFPAQFLPPTREVINGSNENNASPGQYDEVLSLEHMEPGEHMIRSISGSYVFVKNSGEIELATSKLHRLSLNEDDGALEISVEKERKAVGNFKYYNGPYDSGNLDEFNKGKHHIKMSFKEDVPLWGNDEILTQQELQGILNSSDMDIFSLGELAENTFELQMSNVFSEADETPLISSIDEDELFFDAKIKKEAQTRLHLMISKSGSLELVGQDATAEKSATLQFTDKKIGIALEQSENQYTIELKEEGINLKAQGIDSSEILLSPDGDVRIKLGEQTHSFKALMERVNQLSVLNKLEKI